MALSFITINDKQTQCKLHILLLLRVFRTEFQCKVTFTRKEIEKTYNHKLLC